MKKWGAVAVLVAALTLAGCSTASEDTGAVSDAQGVAESPTAAPITMTPEPDTSPAETENPYGDAEAQEATYLESVKTGWQGELPSDSELIGAGHLACDQISAGTEAADVMVVQGDSSGTNNQRVVGQALGIFCPEFY